MFKPARVISIAATIALLGSSFGGAVAHATVFAMPDQASCDNGSTTLTWAGEAISRPQIASMTVDGVAIVDPANPEVDSLGASVCPVTSKGNRTGVYIYYHTDEGNTSDLSIATTPAGTPVTDTTQISITMTDLGTNAANLTFSLVYGSVSSWTTANLGTSSASLSFTISPVRTPQGSGDDFGGCTAVPPDCHATQSDSDVLGASLVFSFEPNVGSNMVGAYFALTGAMGGYVTSATAIDGSKTLVATLGAPHFLADGVTLNTGSMTAFLPQAVLNSLFGLTGADMDAATLDVIRTAGTTSTSAIPFTITPVTGGVTVNVPTITFSSPKYTIKMTAAGIQKQKIVAVTPSKYKSTFTVAGKNIKANGKATYKLSIVVKNKLGKALKIQPIITSSTGVRIGKPTFKGATWTFNVSATSAGLKKLKITAKSSIIKTLPVTFVKA